MMLTRLRGLLSATLVVAFVVGSPIALYAVRSLFSWQEIQRFMQWSTWTSRDDGTLALQLIYLGAWIAWVWLTISLLLAAIASLRGTRLPQIPGLPLATSHRIIASVALLFISVPAAGNVTAEQSVATPDLPRRDLEPIAVRDPGTSSLSTTNAPSSTEEVHTDTVLYEVKRGESLWRIAEEQLGDGHLYTEIVELNRHVLGPDIDFLKPGTILRLPARPTAPGQTSDRTIVVERGDTLSEIADEELGDPDRYPEIFAASEDTTQPGGSHLSDPDLIQPGWTLTIPTAEPSPDAPSTPPESPGPAAPKPPLRPPEQHQPTKPDHTTQSEPSSASSSADSSSAAEAGFTPSWLLPGLATSGALLAGSLLVMLRQRRRTQRRYRQPGMTIAPPPPELLAVEKSIHFAGADAVDAIRHLDRLLRAIPEPPQLLAVELGNNQVTLHLAAPADLPGPWTGKHVKWTAPIKETSDVVHAQAPYPLLASIGASPSGHLWLLNLEQLTFLNLNGDAALAKALALHLATELAVSPWSSLVEVETLGIGEEIADIDPVRMHHRSPSDHAAIDRLAAELDPSGLLPGFEDEPDRFRALIASEDSESVRKVVKAITAHPGRPGATVVVLDAHADQNAPVLTLTSDGHVSLDDLGLPGVRLEVAGLTSEEAAMSVAILHAADHAENVPMPPDDTVPEGLEAMIDTVGAVRDEYVVPRAEDPEPSATADTSLEVDERGEAIPRREAVAPRDSVDSDLEEDLAMTSPTGGNLPKLSVLGPVKAVTHGDQTAVASRRPYYTEVLAYLALHPSGVSRDQLIEAVGIPPTRVRAVMGTIRAWLGTNPRTGRPHLPDSRETKAAQVFGQPTYQLEDVLVDFDLFRGIRARGQARGADGIDDLISALSLVTGEPFTKLRANGWTWLLEGDRIDQVAICAIVDVAHAVTTRALAENDLEVASYAARVGVMAAPDDDVSRLDIIAVLQASGHYDLAQQQLDEFIHDRADDDRGPIDLPDRTAEIVDRLRDRQRRNRTN